MLDVLFRDALIVDGSGGPAYRGDLAVEGERIAAVGRLPQAQAATVVEAHGKALAPGPIDVHVHSELEKLAGRHTAGVLMGVTTELICPDGSHFAPRALPRPRRHRAGRGPHLGCLPLCRGLHMAAFPAQRFGLADRGLLRPGYAADLVLFEPRRHRRPGRLR